MASDPAIVFYDPIGADTYEARPDTRGPWHPDHQHGGPPAGLLARAIESLLPPGFAVARFTAIFARPVPITRLRLAKAMVRDGRTVKEASATLSLENGTEVARANALAIAARTVDLPALPPPSASAPVPPEQVPTIQFPFALQPVGYHTAMELRFGRGAFGQGAAHAWMRMRGSLVPGETPSPLVRVAVAADSTNGVSFALPVDRYTFINPDLTIVLARPLTGEWVCLDSETTVAPVGTGMAVSRLWDRGGLVGQAAQTLVVAQRP
jgi:hypothetical protein